MLIRIWYLIIMELSKQHCIPCEVGGEPLSQHEAARLLAQLEPEWELNDAGHLEQQFKFKNFEEAMVFVNKVAGLAEAEGHHPDIKINYNRVTLELWTHAVKGLHENDFILASKIDAL